MEEKESPEECLRRELLEELGVHVRAVKKLPVIWHAYTKFRVRLHAYTCELCPPGQKIVLRTAVEGQWILMGELDNFAFSSANRRLIKTFRKRD